MPRKIKYTTAFGERLRHLRLAKGLTQEELGKMIGVSHRMVRHYEIHAKFPPVEIISAIAKALKVSADDLLGLKPLKEEDVPKFKNLLRRFKLVHTLPLRDQRAVFSLINALLTKHSFKTTKH